MLIGVTGNIGSGKTKVAKRLASLLGGEVLDADQICRELMEPGNDGFKAFYQQGGQRFVTDNGTLDRAALRRALFKEPVLKTTLESILHPLVREEVLRVGHTCSEGARVVAEIPLLFESCWEDDFDFVVAVRADEAVMIKRVLERDGGEAESARIILASQMSQDEKCLKADYVIDNSGEWICTETQIVDLAVKLRRKNKENKSID